MRFGVGLPHFGHLAKPEPIREMARAVEDLGFDSLWASDHIVVPSGTPFLPDELTEILATVAFLAGETRRVQLGTSVLVVPYRPAVFTAKFLSTLDVLAEGRLAVGVGVGRLVGEFEALGVDFADRWARTDEDLRVWDNLWTTDDSSFDGRWSSYRDIRLFPTGHGGRAGPPIYFGGGSPKAIDRAAQVADGWHPIMVGPQDLTASFARYRKACAEHGRGPGFISLRFMAGYPTVDLDAWPFPGEASQQVDAVEQFRAMGVDELVFDATMLAMSEVDAAGITRLLEVFARDVLHTV